jgi:hypothetical protein
VGVWTCVKNLAPTGIRSLDRPARSQLLYWLSYLAHWKMWGERKTGTNARILITFAHLFANMALVKESVVFQCVCEWKTVKSWASKYKCLVPFLSSYGCDKLVPVHAVKAHWGSKSISPPILQLDGVSGQLHAAAASCRSKSPGFLLNRKLGELWAGVDKNNHLTLTGIELQFLSFPACILMTIPTELFWSLLYSSGIPRNFVGGGGVC